MPHTTVTRHKWIRKENRWKRLEPPTWLTPGEAPAASDRRTQRSTPCAGNAGWTFLRYSHPGGGGVSVVDIPRPSRLQEIATGAVPNYAISKRDGSRVYVSNAGSGTIAEINTADWTIVRNLQAGKTPEHIVLSPDERYLYVANPGSGTSHVWTWTRRKSRQPTAWGGSHGVDLSDDGRLLYASVRRTTGWYSISPMERKAVPLAPPVSHHHYSVPARSMFPAVSLPRSGCWTSRHWRSRRSRSGVKGMK